MEVLVGGQWGHTGPIAFVYKNLVTIEIKENVLLLFTWQVAKPRHPTRI